MFLFPLGECVALFRFSPYWAFPLLLGLVFVDVHWGFAF